MTPPSRIEQLRGDAVFGVSGVWQRLLVGTQHGRIDPGCGASVEEAVAARPGPDLLDIAVAGVKPTDVCFREVIQTSHFKAVRTVFDPNRTSTGPSTPI